MKFYLSICKKWEDNIPSSHFQRTLNNYSEIVKEDCHDKWQITKKKYLYSMGGIFPQKYQRRLANKLLLDFDCINWPFIYEIIIIAP